MFHGRNADMRLIEQPFLSGLFLKGLACTVTLLVAGSASTSRLREALAFQLLGRDGSSAMRLAKHCEPRLREAAPSYHTFCILLCVQVSHVVFQCLPCFLCSNLLNSCARQVAPRLLPALPSRCTPLSSRLGHCTFPKGYGATWCVCVCHRCHIYILQLGFDWYCIGWKAGRDPIKATPQLVPFFFLQPEYTQLLPKQQCTWSMT